MDNPTDPDDLRKAAEEKLAREYKSKQTPPSAEKTLHELMVYQIELEMQNETLRKSQIELEESRDRYMELYDFAPVGYLTLTDSGMIAEANLTSARQLGVERNKLLNHRFDLFVTPEYRDSWRRLFMRVMKETNAAAGMELQRNDGSSFKAHIDCRRDENGLGKPILCITITDITGSSVK